jgi:hypothetical protein
MDIYLVIEQTLGDSDPELEQDIHTIYHRPCTKTRRLPGAIYKTRILPIPSEILRKYELPIPLHS